MGLPAICLDTNHMHCSSLDVWIIPITHRSIVHFYRCCMSSSFCNTEICCAFGIYTTFPQILVNVEAVHPTENLQNSLAIEMDDNVPDPLISLEFSVRLTCSLLHAWCCIILWSCGFVFATASSFVLVLHGIFLNYCSLLHLSVVFQVHTYSLVYQCCSHLFGHILLSWVWAWEWGCTSVYAY